MTFRRAVLVLGAVAVAIAIAAAWNILGSFPVPSAYSFPRHSMFGGSDAQFVGFLEEVDGCIRAAGDASFAVVWPPGYWPTIEDGEPVVRRLARGVRMGEPVQMGGGYYEDGQPPPGSRYIGECAPPFFLSTGLSD